LKIESGKLKMREEKEKGIIDNERDTSLEITSVQTKTFCPPEQKVFVR
jgi:hypothetical protein